MVRIPKGVVVSSITFPSCIIFTFARYNDGFSNDPNCGLVIEMICFICVLLSFEAEMICSSFPASLPEEEYNSVDTVNGALFKWFCIEVSTTTEAALSVTDGVVM